MKVIHLVWKTEAFIDLWSLVHILCGMSVGYILATFSSFSFLTSFGISFLAMVVWEIFEYVVHIGERWQNIVSDLIIGPIGFLIGYLFLATVSYGNTIFWVSVFLMLMLDAFGIRASIQRKKREPKTERI